MLNPELESIRRRFDELVASVDAGHLSIEDALHTLNSLVAVDATGAEWRMDPTGVFLRGMPGQTPSATDPANFITIGLRPQTNSPRYAPTDLHTPPVASRAGDQYAPSFTAPGSEEQYSGYPSQSLPPSQGHRSTDAPRPKPTIFDRLPFKSGRRRQIVVLGIAVLAILFIILRPHGSPSPTVTTDVISTSGGIPTSSGTDTTPSSTVSVPASDTVPSAKQAAGVVKALSSNRAAAMKALPTGSVNELLTTASSLAAAARLGFTLSAGAVSLTAEGTPVVAVDIFDKNKLVAAWQVPLTKVDGRWVASGPAVLRP